MHVTRTTLVALLLSGTAMAQLPPPPVPPQNPITPEKAVLGKILFWEEQLSSDNTVACGTCHLPSSGGSSAELVRNPGDDGIFGTPDDQWGAPGITSSDSLDRYQPDGIHHFDPQVTGRGANSHIMAAYHRELFWDGRATSNFIDPESGVQLIPQGGALESQAVGPVVSDVEMAHQDRDWDQITAKLETATPMALATDLPADMAAAIAADPTYPQLFANAFGDSDVSAARIAFALATYQRTLIPDDTAFDTNSLNQDQRDGLDLFRGRGRCVICHDDRNGRLFTDDRFHTIGLRPPDEDLGRFEVTGDPRDRGSFKTPSLRNVGLRDRYMHTGQFRNLRQVIEFYNRGGDFGENQDPEIRPLGLNDREIGLIIEFLRGGLTSPSSLDETGVFTRPTLWSERADQADFLELYGDGSTGSGDFIPQMLARTPANLGNTGFKFGLYDALGQASTLLAIADTAAPPGTFLGDDPIHVDLSRALLLPFGLTQGAGAGAGHHTLRAPLADDPAFAGVDFFAQWIVLDPGSTNNVAVSPGVRYRLF